MVQMGRLELPPGVVTRHGPEPCASANSATSACRSWLPVCHSDVVLPIVLEMGSRRKWRRKVILQDSRPVVNTHFVAGFVPVRSPSTTALWRFLRRMSSLCNGTKRGAPATAGCAAFWLGRRSHAHGLHPRLVLRPGLLLPKLHLTRRRLDHHAGDELQGHQGNAVRQPAPPFTHRLCTAAGWHLQTQSRSFSYPLSRKDKQS